MTTLITIIASLAFSAAIATLYEFNPEARAWFRGSHYNIQCRAREIQARHQRDENQ